MRRDQMEGGFETRPYVVMAACAGMTMRPRASPWRRGSRRPRSSSASTSATWISSARSLSPHRIATFLQRIGRSGHFIGGLPKGRIFPLTRDDLIECAAMVRAVHEGELDRLSSSPTSRSTSSRSRSWPRYSAEEEWDEGDMLELVRRAYPYRDLEQARTSTSRRPCSGDGSRRPSAEGEPTLDPPRQPSPGSCARARDRA